MGEWHPIATAPKDGTYILISNGVCWPPEIVSWRREVPKHVRARTTYLRRPAGWFQCCSTRSRFCETRDSLMSATQWHPLPVHGETARCAGLDELVASHNKARHVEHEK